MWKAEGVVINGTHTITPDHPITNADALKQFNDVVKVCTNDGTVTASGNGFSYPTSQVVISVDTVIDNTGPGQTWVAAGNPSGTDDVVRQVVPQPQLADPIAVDQYAWALAACEYLMAEEVIGNRPVPYEVHMHGNSSGPNSSVTLIIRRPTHGYEY